MRRRHLLGTIAGGALSGMAGCGLLSSDCPDNPFVDSSFPPSRRLLQFLSDENRPEGVEAAGPPSIQIDENASQVFIRGVFNGASPKSQFPKNMIVVNRLAYNEQENTLNVRLVERQCKSQGAGVAEVTPYELRVKFPEDLPEKVCAQEGPDGLFGEPDGTYSKCVSR